MLDYYAQYACPPEDVIINDILCIVSKKYFINKQTIENTIRNELLLNGGIESMGSYKGYHVFGKNDLLNRTVVKLNKYKFTTFKSTITWILCILRLYHGIK